MMHTITVNLNGKTIEEMTDLLRTQTSSRITSVTWCTDNPETVTFTLTDEEVTPIDDDFDFIGENMHVLMVGFKALNQGKQDEFADMVKAMWDEPECKMCGKDRGLNDEGYCGQCWGVWNS